MTKQTEAPTVDDFDLDDLAAVDQTELVIRRRDGTPTNWKWIIAGPGHPQSIALGNRMKKDHVAREREQEAARVNGRKWKGDQETADEAYLRRIETLAERVIGWTPIKFNGEDYPFSRENVVSLLMDPARGDTLVRQLSEFFDDEKSFMKRSEKA